MLKKDLEVKVKELSREVTELQNKLSIQYKTISNYLEKNFAVSIENDKLNDKLYQIEQIIGNSKGFPILKRFGLKKSIKKILEKK